MEKIKQFLKSGFLKDPNIYYRMKIINLPNEEPFTGIIIYKIHFLLWIPRMHDIDILIEHSELNQSKEKYGKEIIWRQIE